MLTFVLLFSCVGHLLIAFAVPNSLYFASVIIGFCFGAQWPLVFAIISELFGLKYYSTLYNFGAVASPVGSYILNVKVAGHLYDKEALKQLEASGVTRVAGQDLTCTGAACYKLSFIIITAATLFGCIISFILVIRTKKFYQGDIYKKFRQEANKAEINMASSGNGILQLGETESKATVTATATATEDTTTTMDQPTQICRDVVNFLLFYFAVNIVVPQTKPIGEASYGDIQSVYSSCFTSNPLAVSDTEIWNHL
ncbi:hypothetical protein CK203_114336 [Vitis vinifera]|uniref:NFD4 C-terminal domain-containing protein n=1 Tax=Vitis vinifera TaxID=29760 RepID=A0A438EJX5_VITVI|nr:hypothetical protein CK203_114336 [Vitis vinifera]